ncbi:TIR domain-containing protein [Hyalangium sp.]|uniref:TIR domain-containing protein n=1 Tax=Hyalangium sp. TaxID=2028555 RepID=UPI002D793F8A|nr:TIR domain-containing protein [Hyalangium sp.]
MEEELNYLQFSRKGGAHEQARKLLRSALAALVQDRESGLSHWAAGAVARLPSDFLYLEEGQGLVKAAELGLPGGLVRPAPPSGEVPGWLASFAQARLERIRLGVKLFPGYVELGPEGDEPESTIEVPRTAPLVVEVAEPTDDAPAGGRRVFISYSRRQESPWREELVRALRAAHHQVIGGDPFELRESFMSVVHARIRQSDAAVLLISEGALSNEWDSLETHALLARKRKEGERFALLPVYLKPASKDMLAQRWPAAQELLSLRSITVEDPANPQSPTALILAALETSPEPVKSWQRIELHPPRPHRLPLQSGRVRLRTLLGDEYIIEPREPASLLRMPPPDPVFIGYRRELSDVLEGVERGLSFIFIHGPAGAGKTELVRQVAASVASRFSDGTFYVEGRQGGPRFNAREVIREVLRALDPSASQDHRDEPDRYRELTSSRRILLVLDGVSGPSADEGLSVSDLPMLVPGPGSLLILTERQERGWEFVLPQTVILKQPLRGLEPEAAVELLSLLAPHVGEEAARLVDACSFLPGPLRRVAEVLTQQLPEVAVSHYAFFLERAHVLSAFSGTFEREAARAVIESLVAQGAEAGEREGGAPFLVDEMVRLRLVQPAAELGRFMLWPPVRQAAEAFSDQTEIMNAEQRHAGYFVEVLEALNERYRAGGGARAEAIVAFDRDWPDMAVGFERAGSHESAHGEVEEGFVNMGLIRRYSLAAGPLMRLRRPPRERERWHRMALRATTAEQSGYAAHRLGLGLALADLGMRDDAIIPSTDDAQAELARLYVDAGRWEEAEKLFFAVVLRTEADSREVHQIAQLQYVAACLARHSGSLDDAEQKFESARDWAARAADVRLEVDVMLGLAGVAVERGVWGIAGARFIEAMDFARDHRDERGLALGSWEFGRLRARQGDLKVGREFMQRLVDYRRSIGHVEAESTAQEMEQELDRADSRGGDRISH